MDIKQLKYFIHVAQCGSYTRASEVIGIDQPVLSRQIRQLETNLKRNLFLRHGRGVVLTDAGEKLLSYSKEILQLVEKAEEDLVQNEGNLTGNITLGLPPTLAKMLSVAIIKQFQQLFPNAKLSIVESLTVNLEENIHLGRVDLALINTPTSSYPITTKLIANENLCLIGKVNDPTINNKNTITLKEIEALPLIMPNQNNTFRIILEKEMLKQDIHPHIIWEIDSVSTIIELVIVENMGYAILSPSTQNFIKENTFKALPITSPYLLNHIYLATSEKKRPTMLQIKVEKMLKELCANYFPPLVGLS